MGRPTLLILCVLLAVLALAVSAPLRQRRQLGDYMGEAMGNQYSNGDNDYYGAGNNDGVYVNQGYGDNSQVGYGGYEDFGGYGGFEGGNEFI